MQSKTPSVTQGDSHLYNVSESLVHAQPWCNITGSFNTSIMRHNYSDLSSMDQSMDSQSQSEGGINEEDNVIKQSEGTICETPDRNYGQVDQIFQQDSAAIRRSGDKQPPQPELVGHSIACAMNPYDPYGGMMAAYSQPSVPIIYDVHHTRMMLPMEMAQEPVYVNAKQYHGILRRRQSRAKAELEKKLIKARKPYLHESRHQHALRRARGSGGRFAKKSDADTSKETRSGSAISTQSLTSTSSETLPSESSEMKVLKAELSCNNDISSVRKQINLSDAREEGCTSNQQWRNIVSNRSLAMQ
ncbi:nuclear transcription factor Y subunit A-1-like isoform X1 [Olea europaea var. sylvestris]|uniref:Nuclear transcription factor Y subunit n=1 Tax=Olea europaea subsp. europaea TaxID=158383 RepID=A0A8S0T0H8_OLEEU|nr:nuclear transcription factor Y subunit A-1-like isoform X1 [Olea europaea var. sylvestris]CAA2998431.1 nuclear transcription factor Y subunit A-1-like [Olea europaea subsp. europaea]